MEDKNLTISLLKKRSVLSLFGEINFEEVKKFAFTFFFNVDKQMKINAIIVESKKVGESSFRLTFKKQGVIFEKEYAFSERHVLRIYSEKFIKLFEFEASIHPIGFLILE